jgi:uncharacterized membrane protein
MLVAGIVTLLVLDFIWISINSKTYEKMVFSVQNSKLRFNYVGAIIAYSAMVIGFVFIVMPMAKQDVANTNVVKALKYGAVFGFVTYTIFNATNYAIFVDYSPYTSVLDTLWGTFVYFMATLVALAL